MPIITDVHPLFNVESMGMAKGLLAGLLVPCPSILCVMAAYFVNSEHRFDSLNTTALACIVFKHLRKLLFIITGDTVGQHMDGKAGFSHIVTGGFNASCGICSGNKKFGDVACLDKGGKFFAGQSVALCFCENVF